MKANRKGSSSSFFFLTTILKSKYGIQTRRCPLLSSACMCAKSPQLCLTLCDRMDYSPPGSSVQGSSRQVYWSGLPFPSPGDLPNPGTESVSPV